MKLPAAMVLALAATACNSQNGGANQAAGVTPGPSVPAIAQTMQPGRWETTTRIVSIDMPNATPEQAAMLRAQPLPPPETQASCVTPEESVDVVGTFVRQIQKGQSGATCEVGERQYGGGRIRFSMTCRGQPGQPDQRLAIVGTYSATTVQMGIGVDSSMAVGDGSVQSIRADNVMTGRRVGECNGTETD